MGTFVVANLQVRKPRQRDGLLSVSEWQSWKWYLLLITILIFHCNIWLFPLCHIQPKLHFHIWLIYCLSWLNIPNNGSKLKNQQQFSKNSECNFPQQSVLFLVLCIALLCLSFSHRRSKGIIMFLLNEEKSDEIIPFKEKR